jgi:hypothetical protein
LQLKRLWETHPFLRTCTVSQSGGIPSHELSPRTTAAPAIGHPLQASASPRTPTRDHHFRSKLGTPSTATG